MFTRSSSFQKLCSNFLETTCFVYFVGISIFQGGDFLDFYSALYFLRTTRRHGQGSDCQIGSSPTARLARRRLQLDSTTVKCRSLRKIGSCGLRSERETARHCSLISAANNGRRLNLVESNYCGKSRLSCWQAVSTTFLDFTAVVILSAYSLFHNVTPSVSTQ